MRYDKVHTISNTDFVMFTVAATDRIIEAATDNTTRAVPLITATEMAVITPEKVLIVPRTLVRIFLFTWFRYRLPFRFRWVPPYQGRKGTRSGTHPFILRQLGLEFFKLPLEGRILGCKFPVAHEDFVFGF